ncbi:MAG TPA: hypothetical protein VKB96_05790, partial [Gammaproteobacteria bacterium]|nr:hypothetical protein [Gammaproteobacteria bacterium]
MAISIGAYVSVYYFLRYFLNLDGEISGGIAGLCFGLIVHIDQALKNGTIRIWHPTWPRDVVPLEQYALSWRLMILYGTFLSLSALTSFVLLIALWGSR